MAYSYRGKEYRESSGSEKGGSGTQPSEDAFRQSRGRTVHWTEWGGLELRRYRRCARHRLL